MSYINLGNLKLKERRNKSRKLLTGLLPGKMRRNEFDRCISCKPIDVSDNGLGILSAEEISIGETLTLEIGDEKVVFEVVWSKPDFGKFDLIRYGLVCSSKDKNIADIFMKAGMMS